MKTKKAKKRPVVWFVEIESVVLAVFAHEEDATNFFEMMDDGRVSGSMYSRTLHYGQPENRGYNQ